ncbi:MAG: N-acetylmuramoyl-L-alanine amidase [Deltaproteobacteria bacterium]|nr:N-acetylmuramoyl-L-alanine amidase [Deltaproteobacteria bacterium]
MLKSLSIFLGFLLIFSVALFALFSLSQNWRFNAIVIHHTASMVDNYRSISTYQRQEHGWSDAAYHLILSNGSTEVPFGYLEATGRYRFMSECCHQKYVLQSACHPYLRGGRL